MSRYKWIENKFLERIVTNVYDDTYGHKDNNKKPDSYDIKIKTDYEFLIICDALNNLSKYVKGKREAGSRTKNPKKYMLEMIENLGKALCEYNLINEYLDHLMPINAKIKQLEVTTAKQYATSIAKSIENSLLDEGTSNKRIKHIKRFITDAVIAIAKNPSHYKNDLHELSKASTNN